MVATEPALDTALEHSWAFLLLELYVVVTDLALDTAIERRRSFLLLELSVVATNFAIILALNRTLLNPCLLALVLNATLAIFMLTAGTSIMINHNMIYLQQPILGLQFI